jgi:pyruvate/2-oxoglutarate dehydrogenase complex dihydrolipoamide dehydrogenase (E3) component
LHIVVLGGGSTGEHFVGALRRYDREARVTVVERRLVGGECSYWACMPTKTMLRGPEVRAEAERTLGALSPGPLDAKAVYAWRDIVAQRDDSSQVEWLESMGARLVRGDAVIEEPGFVTVGDEELRYDKLLVATGSSPVIPDVVDGIDHWTNHDATETTEVP